METETLVPQFVEYMPKPLAPGFLYISITYRTTSHLCACGCGNRVVLPISPAEWQLLFDGDSVSMSPSVGNWEFPCRSHYWIRNNRVRWAKPMTPEQIERRRSLDSEQLDAYFSDEHRELSTEPTGGPKPTLWARVKALFGGR